MKEILRYYVRLFMFLFPVLFLPTAVDAFGFGKNWLLLSMGMVGLLIWVAEILSSKKESIYTNKLVVAGLLLVIWSAITWVKESLGIRTRSIMEVGGLGTMLTVAIWFFLWLQASVDETTQRIDKKETEAQLKWLTGAGILVAIVSVVVFMIPSSKLPIIWPKNNPLLSINAAWSLTGSLLNEAILMLFLVVEWGGKLLEKVKKGRVGDYLSEAAIDAGLTLVLFLDIYRIIKIGWVGLDLNSAWVIAVEAFKRNPLWGVGIGNFWEAFNSYRPSSYNLTPLWTGGFKSSSVGILQLWTETGIVGLGLAALMVAKYVREKKNFDFFKALLILAGVLFLPVNLISLLILAWLASGIFEVKKMGLNLKAGESNVNAAPWISGVLVVAAVAFGGYWMYRLLMGDVYMRQSLVAAGKNDGGSTYNLQIKAIGMNPTNADYRTTYSQTNMALAETILSTKELTDDDKQKASTLIQQAVREAKAAITLDQMNPNYWTNLAVIYKSLVGVVDGSQDWSLQAYQQALTLDPVNPTIRLDMGGLLYAAGNYDSADRIFEQAVALKQDYANAWYNWAYSAKKMENIQSAVDRLTQALALVPVDSGDYDSAAKELATWNKELEAKTASNSAATNTVKDPETLKTPEPLPTGNEPAKVVVPTGELQPPEGIDEETAKDISTTPSPQPTVMVSP